MITGNPILLSNPGVVEYGPGATAITTGNTIHYADGWSKVLPFNHEVGHILLHGKKYISIENISYDGQGIAKEKEADDFAIFWTFSQEEENEVLNSIPLTSQDILNFSKKFGTHPAIIIGRFQHKELIPYNVGREFIESIELND